MKTLTTIAALSMASAGSLLAQSLFDLAPSLTDDQDLPLTWTAGVSVGWDDNPVPLSGNSDDTLFLQGFVGASFLTNTPQTTTSFFARAGALHYLDNLEGADDTAPVVGLGLNVTHRVNDRLRLVSNNSVSYERQPNYSIGTIGANQIGDYLTYSSDNAVGYRWSERFATYTGVRFSGVEYENNNIFAADLASWSVYNQFRYQLTEQTVLTAEVSYGETDVDEVGDSQNIFITAGVEHRFSPTSIVTLRGGVQIREVDNVDGDETSPFGEIALQTQVNQSFSVRGYGRYSIQDFSRGVAGSNVAITGNQVLRVGLEGRLQISEKLSVFAGVNYIDQEYLVDGGNDFDDSIFNAFGGANLALTDSLTLNATYNFEDFSGESNVGGVADRDYNRNRVNLGLTATF